MQKKLLKFKYPLLFLASILIIGLSFYFRQDLAKLGHFGLLGIFLLNILGSATLFLPAPAIATVVAGGIIYNPFLVAITAGLGSAIGDMIGFVLGRSGKEFLFKEGSIKYAVTKAIFQKFAPVIIILFSFIPNPFFDGIGIFAGIFLYSPVKFFAYTLIGRFLRNLALAYLGSSI